MSGTARSIVARRSPSRLPRLGRWSACSAVGIAGGAVATLGNDDSTSATTIAVADEQARASTPPAAPTAHCAPPSRFRPCSPASEAATPKAEAKEPKTVKKAPATKKATPKKAAAPAKPKGSAISKSGWTSPMPGAEITSCFGHALGRPARRASTSRCRRTPRIPPPAAGTVIAAGWAYTGYGISVVIDHGNGYFTHYAHQNRTAVEVASDGQGRPDHRLRRLHRRLHRPAPALRGAPGRHVEPDRPRAVPEGARRAGRGLLRLTNPPPGNDGPDSSRSRAHRRLGAPGRSRTRFRPL